MQTLKSWLSEGPFTLALSSSFFGFFAHCGFLAALEEEALMPRKITGSSAGALVGGGVASGLSVTQIRELLFTVQRDDFWDPGFGLGYLRGKKFRALLERNFVSDFKNAKVPFAAVAFDMLACKTRFLESGSLPHAVAASCAVPFMFHPVRINGRLYWDGGVLHKSAIPDDAKDERVLCVFLENDGLTGAYERKSTFPKLTETHKVIRYRGLPKVDFYTLRGREEAFSECYRRSKAAFAAKLNSNIIEV